MIIKAPAKVNLFLDVLNKRKDGYHNIKTLFLKIGLFDTLRFSSRKNGIRIICKHADVPEDETNLVYKAARLLQQKTDTNKGVCITINKKIPVFAGLGGGSSDAAAALKGLNRFWNLGLDDLQLLEIGRKIGADVAFFSSGYSSAVGTLRGDSLSPVDLGMKFWIILIYPGIRVSTKQIYEGLPSNLTKADIDVKLLIRAIRTKRMELIEKTLFNRLESVAFKYYKQLREIKENVSAHGVRAVLMSGSGSSIFGLSESREEARRLKKELDSAFEVRVVRSL